MTDIEQGASRQSYRLRTLEAELEGQRAELGEAQELAAEAAVTDDEELVREASYEVTRRKVDRPLLSPAPPCALPSIIQPLRA